MQGRTGKCVNKHSPRVAGNPAGVGTCTKADTLPLAAWADSLGLSDRLLLRHSLRAAPRVCRLPSTHPSGRISAAPSASPNITPSSSPMMLRHKRRGHPVNLKMGQKTRFVGKYLGDSYSLRIESLVLRLLEAQQANTGYRFTDQAVLSVRSLFASSYSDQDLKPWRIWLQPSSLTKLLLAMSIACPPSNLSPSYAEFIELLLNLAEMPSLPIAIQSQLLEPYVPKDKIRQTSLEPKDAALSALSWPSAGSPESDDSSSRGSATTASDQKRRITVQSLMNMDDSLDDACDLVGLIPLSSSYELSRATTTEAIRVFFDSFSPRLLPCRLFNPSVTSARWATLPDYLQDIIVALGLSDMARSQTDQRAIVPYYMKSRASIVKALEDPTLETVQGFLLLARLSKLMGHLTVSNNFLFIATRLAIRMGLQSDRPVELQSRPPHHVVEGDSESRRWFEGQVRRRTWYSCCFFILGDALPDPARGSDRPLATAVQFFESPPPSDEATFLTATCSETSNVISIPPVPDSRFERYHESLLFLTKFYQKNVYFMTLYSSGLDGLDTALETIYDQSIDRELKRLNDWFDSMPEWTKQLLHADRAEHYPRQTIVDIFVLRLMYCICAGMLYYPSLVRELWTRGAARPQDSDSFRQLLEWSNAVLNTLKTYTRYDPSIAHINRAVISPFVIVYVMMILLLIRIDPRIFTPECALIFQKLPKEPHVHTPAHSSAKVFLATFQDYLTDALRGKLTRIGQDLQPLAPGVKEKLVRYRRKLDIMSEFALGPWVPSAWL